MFFRRSSKVIFLLGLLVLSLAPRRSYAEDSAILTKIMERLERLEKKQAVMEKQLKEKDARINELENELKRAQQGTTEAPTQVTTNPPAEKPAAEAAGAPKPAPAPEVGVTTPPNVPETEEAKPATAPEIGKEAPPEENLETGSMTALLSDLKARAKWKYEPGKGFRVFTSKWGEMN